jgi:hypothetical protein
MGLDLYVGTLSRYHSGDWETQLQKWARENGVGYQRVNPTDSGDSGPSTVDLVGVVQAWRSELSRRLGQELGTSLEWDERPEAPCFSLQLGWDPYADLLLWAAYAEHPDLSRPERGVHWTEDPEYQASHAGGFKSGAGTDLESNARLGFSLLLKLTKESVSRRLPMRMSY